MNDQSPTPTLRRSIFWELGLAVYLTVKGFKPSPILDGLTGAAPRERMPVPAFG